MVGVEVELVEPAVSAAAVLVPDAEVRGDRRKVRILATRPEPDAENL